MSLRENCPNAKFFLVRIFMHSDQEKLRIWTLFTQYVFIAKLGKFNSHQIFE